MARTFLSALRAALFSRRAYKANPSAARRRLRLKLEALEPRQLLAAAPPHTGGGTLFDEHDAVMQLVQFNTIHDVAAGGATANYYYQATGKVADPIDHTYHWSDVRNWVLETWDASPDPTDLNAQSFVPTPAQHLPMTGDDVEIPLGLV